MVIFKFTQLCINARKSDNRINKAASDLQSMLLEPMFYSDVCLLYCFHERYFKDHMLWLMKNGDLTNRCGWAINQMAVRTYVMERNLIEAQEDLNESLEDMAAYNGIFHPFMASLEIVVGNGKLKDDESQRNKCATFLEMALDKHVKHFYRFVDPIFHCCL